MGKEKVLFKTEEKRSRAEVAAFLRELAGKVDEGEVTLQRGDEKQVLQLPGQLTLEVKAEEEAIRKGSAVKMSLEVELEWKPGEDDQGSLSLG